MSETYEKGVVSISIKMSTSDTNILLHSSELDDPFINSPFANQTIHSDLLRLTDTVRAIHCLRVVRRIPVVLVKYHSISSSQIDPKTSGVSTEEENKYLRSMRQI